MATETIVRVTCDICDTEHYYGPLKNRPRYLKVTFWDRDIGWEPDDLCEKCAEILLDNLRRFKRPSPEDAIKHSWDLNRVNAPDREPRGDEFEGEILEADLDPRLRT